jgi:hypothetical protein
MLGGASAAQAKTKKPKLETLTGTIKLTTGADAEPYTGSWVRLYETADPTDFFENPSSPAANKSYTPLVNGTQGLELNTVQAEASPAFDEKGNSLSNAIITPQPFATINFGIYTSAASVLEVDKDKNATDAIASANLTGWTVAYAGNSNYATPGSTPPTGNLTGSITWVNAKKHKLGGTVTLNWSVQIKEAPFEAYTAEWQVVGTLEPVSKKK